MQQASEIKVGILAIAVILLALVTAGNLKGGIGQRSRGYTFEIWFREAPGVGKGSPVRLAGVDVGQVMDKDIVSVTEDVTLAPSSADPRFAQQMVTVWSAGERGAKGYVEVLAETRPLTNEEAQAVSPYRRTRHVARLQVQVLRQHEVFSNYRYEIMGGLLFGDRQLNVSDLGRDGMPLSVDERGDSVRALVGKGRRVAVLGRPPVSIDQVVQNAEKVMDADTTDRLKRIVANVDHVTEQAADLLKTAHAIVKANERHADTMMANFARASEQLAAGISESRNDLKTTLRNVAATTDVARRFASANEGRFERITKNVDDLAARADTLLMDNQKRINATVGDIASIAKDVRETVAADRKHVDEMVKQLAEASRNVNALTGDARERAADVLAKVDDSVGKVRALLADSDAKLRAIITDTAGLVADARGATSGLREDIPKITGDLRATSEQLRNLTGDPALRGALRNTEALTAEARDVLRDIRDITGDREVRDNVRKTVGGLRSSAEAIDRGLSAAKAFRPSAAADVFYGTRGSLWRSDLELALHGAKRSYHVELGNVTSSPAWGVQLGQRLAREDLRVRYGFHRGKLGAGLDWAVDPKLKVRADLYHPNDPRLNARVSYGFSRNLTGVFGVEDVWDKPSWLFGVQLGRSGP